MKKFFSVIFLILIISMGIPILITQLPQKDKKEERAAEPIPEAAQVSVSDKVSVYIKNEDRVSEMDMNQYLKEVVAAEMPVDFYEEALKAQAVAARTYLVNRINTYKENGTPDIHKGASVCTDPTHCKAWISEEARKASWEGDVSEKWAKIANAVDSTDGIIITYEDKPISAVFHSTSSGQTENAIDVWGGDVPYLVSVKSEGDKISPKYNSENSYTVDEFKKICEKNISGTDWSKGIVTDISRSAAGGIITLNIGGVKVKGTDFRSFFNLRSTNAEIEVTSENVNIHVKGYGHGVGMSQYGANFLASEGKNYVEILKTYYTGVDIKKM